MAKVYTSVNFVGNCDMSEPMKLIYNKDRIPIGIQYKGVQYYVRKKINPDDKFYEGATVIDMDNFKAAKDGICHIGIRISTNTQYAICIINMIDGVSTTYTIHIGDENVNTSPTNAPIGYHSKGLCAIFDRMGPKNKIPLFMSEPNKSDADINAISASGRSDVITIQISYNKLIPSVSRPRILEPVTGLPDNYRGGSYLHPHNYRDVMIPSITSGNRSIIFDDAAEEICDAAIRNAAIRNAAEEVRDAAIRDDAEEILDAGVRDDAYAMIPSVTSGNRSIISHDADGENESIYHVVHLKGNINDNDADQMVMPLPIPNYEASAVMRSAVIPHGGKTYEADTCGTAVAAKISSFTVKELKICEIKFQLITRDSDDKRNFINCRDEPSIKLVTDLIDRLKEFDCELLQHKSKINIMYLNAKEHNLSELFKEAAELDDQLVLKRTDIEKQLKNAMNKLDPAYRKVAENWTKPRPVDTTPCEIPVCDTHTKSKLIPVEN